MIGLFSLFTLYARRVVLEMRQRLRIQVDLRNELSETDRAALHQTLTSQPFLAKDASGQPRLEFLTKEQAAERYIQQNEEDFIEFLGYNPLRDAFIVYVQEEYYTNERIDQIKAQLEALPQVFRVKYSGNVIEEINQNIRVLGVVISVFVVILLVTVVILINNAIKLALFSQRFLIRSMQLVGATAMFIKRPFLLRAGVQGAISGGIAAVLLVLLLWGLGAQVDALSGGFAELRSYLYEGLIYLGLVFLGALIGALSAYFAVSRYLRMNLDELN